MTPTRGGLRWGSIASWVSCVITTCAGLGLLVMWADLDRDPGIRLAVALSATAAGYLDLVLISGLVLLGAAVCSAVAAVLLNRAARLAPAPMRPSPPSPYWPPPSGPPLA